MKMRMGNDFSTCIFISPLWGLFFFNDSIGVIVEGDNRVEKGMVLKSVQVVYREDIKKYVIIMMYDSTIRGEKDVQVMRIVNSADDIIKNALEGDDGFINFIITGYSSMDEYSSSVRNNNEIVNGRWVHGSGWREGWYYGGYWCFVSSSGGAGGDSWTEDRYSPTKRTNYYN